MTQPEPGVVPVENLLHYAPAILGAVVRVTVNSHVYVGVFAGVHYNGMYVSVILQHWNDTIPLSGNSIVEVL